jgi:hypothetical protein
MPDPFRQTGTLTFPSYVASVSRTGDASNAARNKETTASTEPTDSRKKRGKKTADGFGTTRGGT